MKNPTITVEGDTFFGKARIYRSNHSIPLWYDDGTNPLNVAGNITFKIAFSDNGLILLITLNLKAICFFLLLKMVSLPSLNGIYLGLV